MLSLLPEAYSLGKSCFLQNGCLIHMKLESSVFAAIESPAQDTALMLITPG